MKALITGASSGIGYDMALLLSKMGYDIIAVARNEERLQKLKEQAKTNVQTLSIDLSDEEACMLLYEKMRGEEITVLINNAGFGLYGEFTETDLDIELSMIHTNITALHILTKLFLQDMKKKNDGYIMNVASIAGFMPGPLMASYYATKAYVVRLTQAIQAELAAEGSAVHICLLCPGPVDTRFNETAKVHFTLKGLNSKDVAKYAITKMFRKKSVIVPGGFVKAARVFGKLFPDSVTAKGALMMQRKKGNK